MDETLNNSAPDTAPVPPPEDEMAVLRKERDEYLAGWQRAKADFSNYRKEESKRMEEIAKYQTEDVMYDLIAVLDNFELALTALERQGPVEKGIYMIRAQMEDILRKRGLVRLRLAPGDPFDPSVAEAIVEVESDLPAGSIAEEIESGYRFHDKILRPARVKISRPRST